MHPDRPSLTASVVSFARGALSADPAGPCYDPFARVLLPPAMGRCLALVESAGFARGAARALVRLALGGLAGHVELRTALVDAAVKEAVDEGVEQLVILGAGLDARAWRMSGLQRADVLEVDHPATQAWKKERAAGLSPACRALHFVPADFERSSLEGALADSPHQPARPTCWVWEGVTPYLRRPAIDATLAQLAARSAPGSRLVMSYLTPKVVAWGCLRGLARLALRGIGEPLLGMISTAELNDRLARLGFAVLSDELPADAGPRYRRSSWRAPFSPAERVAVARR